VTVTATDPVYLHGRRSDNVDMRSRTSKQPLRASMRTTAGVDGKQAPSSCACRHALLLFIMFGGGLRGKGLAEPCPLSCVYFRLWQACHFHNTLPRRGPAPPETNLRDNTHKRLDDIEPSEDMEGPFGPSLPTSTKPPVPSSSRVRPKPQKLE